MYGRIIAANLVPFASCITQLHHSLIFQVGIFSLAIEARTDTLRTGRVVGGRNGLRSFRNTVVQPSYQTVRNPSAEKIVYATRDCILHNDGILACPSGCQAPKGMCQATSGDRYLGCRTPQVL